MNKYLSIGFFYSSAENKTAFAVLEICDQSIEVIVINECLGEVRDNEMSRLLKGIYELHGDCRILIKSEMNELNSNSLSSNSLQQQPARDYKEVYSYIDKLSCNEKRALKLAVDIL
jgi:hypothetical protein